MDNDGSLVKTCICSSTLIVENQKVLFLWHAKLCIWLYPGGHNEKNETPQHTAIRETKEETGMGVKVISPKPQNHMIRTKSAYELPLPFKILYEKVDYKTGKHDHFDMIYLAKPISRQERRKLGKGETSKVRWVGREEIATLNTYENVRLVALAALADNSSK